MPVSKTSASSEAPIAASSTSSRSRSASSDKHDCCLPKDCGSKMRCSFAHDFGKKLLMTLAGILLVYTIFFLGTLIQNNIKKHRYIGMGERQERTMVLEAQGKVTAAPNIAMTTMGMTAEAATVAEAQQKNTEVMNSLIEKLKALGIYAEDIQTTNYNVYPRYDYTEEDGRVLKGYEVIQNVSVKIRDIAKANQVIALAGEVGATNVGGLEFTIDERDVYVAQARQEAMKQLNEKVASVKHLLGVNVVDVVSYEEFEVQPGAGPVYFRGEAGLGGADVQIPSGSMDVTLGVRATVAIQ